MLLFRYFDKTKMIKIIHARTVKKKKKKNETKKKKNKKKKRKEIR